ncbi:MAG TPA: ABC transporter ATP-binding protein [Acidimicrobiales bacterium]|nr:ABC transporter ATP-binding protein [Acidimicrobiales bacterium]
MTLPNDAATPNEADWRGVAAEDIDDVTSSLGAFLRGRSKRLLFSLLQPHKRELSESIAVITVYSLCSLAGPYLVKRALDDGIPRMMHGGSPAHLLVTVGLFVLCAAIAAVADYEFNYLTGSIGQKVLLELRRRLFDHFQRLSISFHERYTSGRVISRLTSDVEALAELLNYGLTTLSWSVLYLVGITAFMLYLDVPLALVALSSLPFVIALTWWFRTRSALAYRATREGVTGVIVQFVETVGGMRAVAAFRREPRNDAIFADLDDKYRRANVWSMRLGAVYGPGSRVIGNCAAAGLLLVGGWRVIQGDVTIGTLAAFLLYIKQLFEPVQEISQFYSIFQSAAAALEKLSGVLEEAPTVLEPLQPADASSLHGGVEFDHVTFEYRPGRPVLHDVDLRIEAGTTIALVGRTGAGKSTIARLLSRFYDPTQGAVRLDGIDLRDLADDDLRRAVVAVTQESFLFEGSIAWNIGLGRPDASRAEIEAAARAIGAHDFIAALPEGYDTDVAKRGGRLSSGQKQLVSFARAFLADPKVLILDEATSSLDLPTERLVQAALDTLLADRTAVIIAHRLSTVEIADRVLVVDDGRIVDDGPPGTVLPTLRIA